MSPTVTNNNQQSPNSIQVTAEVVQLTPLEMAYEDFKNDVITGLNIMQIGFLVQLSNIKPRFNKSRNILLKVQSDYFTELATATNSTSHQRRKE